MKKKIALLMACVMAFGVAVGGTLAWLTDDTAPVTNVFTPSDINITLTETTGEEYKMVPGDTFAKDPKVTVKAGSEAGWLFVKVEESQNLDDFLTYGIIDDWNVLNVTNHPGVYYRKVAASTSDQVFDVIFDGVNTDNVNKVGVNTTVTKKMMNDLVADNPSTDTNESTYPTLKFTAYAIQQAHVGDNATKTEAENALAAWNEIHST